MSLGPRWQKSTRSNPSGNCLEARIVDENVQIRDSKDAAGPTLSCDVRAWRALLREVSREL